MLAQIFLTNSILRVLNMTTRVSSAPPLLSREGKRKGLTLDLMPYWDEDLKTGGGAKWKRESLTRGLRKVLESQPSIHLDASLYSLGQISCPPHSQARTFQR